MASKMSQIVISSGAKVHGWQEAKGSYEKMNFARRLFKIIYDFLILPPWVQLRMFLGPLWWNRKVRGEYRSTLGKLDLKLSSKITKVDIDELIGEKAKCVLLNPTRRDGNLSLDAQFCIACLVKHYKPRRIFEIGTFNGNTTLQMAVNSGNDCQIFTLHYDPAKLETPDSKFKLAEGDKKYIGNQEMVFRSTPYENKINLLFGDSAQFDFYPYYGRMDFVFIDGSHAYDYVRNDTEQAFRMLGEKGVIIWDDYDASWPDVIRYLNELAQQKEICWINGTSLCLHIK